MLSLLDESPELVALAPGAKVVVVVLVVVVGGWIRSVEEGTKSRVDVVVEAVV